MNFTLTTLGTASALPTVSRYPSAHVLNIRGRLFLIDCGEGCQMQLRRYGVSMLNIDHIFISHLHGDHCFGLFGLLSTMGMMNRTTPLTIHAPFLFGNILKFFMDNFTEGLPFEVRHETLQGKEPRLIFETRNIEALSFGLNHRIDAFGFIFREKEPELNVHKWLIERDALTLHEIVALKGGNDVTREDGTVLKASVYTYRPFEPRTYVHCCDTAPFAREAEYAKGATLLYHEATFESSMARKAAATFHSTALQAAQVALEAGAGRLVIGHYSSRYTDPAPLVEEARTIFPETYPAKEGSVFELPLVKNEQ